MTPLNSSGVERTVSAKRVIFVPGNKRYTFPVLSSGLKNTPYKNSQAALVLLSIKEFPDLNKQQISACLDYARDCAEFEVADVCIHQDCLQVTVSPASVINAASAFASSTHLPASTMSRLSLGVWVIVWVSMFSMNQFEDTAMAGRPY